jgi:UDP-N-acetylglucosamine--N-acetylmuramyl-(pentapeptide) pyrophosphoryl-undecaprenol N-acetylglucosamine transferase
VPALAVAEALRAEGAEVSFVGGERAEAQLVPAAGFELRSIAVEGIDRTNPRRALRAIARAAVSLPRARRLLRASRPDVVMGGGGYVAGPVGLAALSLRVPLVLSEADSHLGLTNRLLAPFARRVCLAFPLEGRDGPRYRVTGRPIPALTTDRTSARELFGISSEETLVLVFGGSLGARSINLAAIEAFSGAPFRVLHVCGQRDYVDLSRTRLRAGYDLREYLDLADFAKALAAADLVVARSGGSVFEIAAHGLPAILIPYPHAAGDHQTRNARWLADAGAAIAIEDKALTGARLGSEVARLLAEPHRLSEMGAAARRLARPNAAADIASELLLAAGA